MPGWCASRASSWETRAAVAAKLAPSGSRTSTKTSSRSEAGKNWLGTFVNPATETANTRAVSPSTTQRRRTHQRTSERNA